MAHADPARDWYLLLLLTGVGIVAIILWNIYLFTTVASGGTIGTPASTPSQTVEQSAFDTVREIFLMRDSEEANYKSGVYSYTDPSR